METSLAAAIDYTLLHAALTDRETRDGCRLARELGAACACVQPCAVPLASEELAGSKVAVGTIVGFPLGASATEIKVLAMRLACEQGAHEVDFVVNVGKILSDDWDYVEAEVRAVVDTAHAYGGVTKVVFATEYLPSDELKIRLCEIADRAGAEFVKTSTGFSLRAHHEDASARAGASEQDVPLMRAHCSSRIKVTAAGGICDYDDVVRLRALGADRVATNALSTIASQAVGDFGQGPGAGAGID
jgi:deoxyribose-phosphate aldolase